MAKKIKITLNDNNNFYAGGDKDEIIFGLGGNDRISGGGGNDKLVGGQGNDVLRGGAGDDAIYGGIGNDMLSGGAGDDVINGGTGNDFMLGGTGDDVINGGTGNDVLRGGAGEDVINGSTGNDVLSGGTGDDTLYAKIGNDNVDGGGDDDTVVLVGNYADAVITATTDGFKIVTASGTAMVKNVELFQFADMTVAASDLIPPVEVTSFTLTGGIDTIVGTASDDAIVGPTSTSLSTFDNVDGSGGMDTMTLTDTTASAMTTNTLATVVNVEKLVVADAGGDFTGDVSTWTGLTSVTLAQGADGPNNNDGDIAITTKNNATSVDISVGTSAKEDDIQITDSGTTTDALASVSLIGTDKDHVTITSDALSTVSVSGMDDGNIQIINSKAHAVTLALDDVSGVSIEDTTATSVTITAVGQTLADDQEVILNVSDATAVTVGGTGAIILDGGSNLSNVLSFDASANSGGVVLDFALDTDAVFTGGTGDDTVGVSGMLTAGGSLSGGAGTDTLTMDAFTAEDLTQNGDFAAKIDSFETLSVGGVATNESRVINLANLDSPTTVISAGNDGGTNELQTITIANNATENFMINVGGVDIAITAGMTTAQIAQEIVNNSSAISANDDNISDIVLNGSDVEITYWSGAGDVAPISAVIDPLDGSSGITPQVATTATPAVLPVAEQQAFTITAGTDADGGSITITTDLGATVLALDGNLSQDAIGALIAAATLTGGGSASYDNASNTVTITTPSSAGDLNAATVGAGGSGATFGAVATIANGIIGTAEIQTIDLTGNSTDFDGGTIIVGGVEIQVGANANEDAIGAAVLAATSGIVAASAGALAGIGYNTTSNVLTFTYNNGFDPGDISITDSMLTTTASVTENTPGVAGGELILDNFVNGGTFVLAGDLDGDTYINVKDALTTANDVVNVTLSGDDGSYSGGALHIDDVTTLNFTTVDTDTVANTSNFGLGVDASATTTITVAGQSGVNFDWNFDNLTSFNASNVTGGSGVGDVSVFSYATSGVTFTGGAGDDYLASNGAATKVDILSGGAGSDYLYAWNGNDVLNGGTGDDTLIGATGKDTMTGGAGKDWFIFAGGDSFGTQIDTITDFQTGFDTIDLSNIFVGLGAYGEEVASVAAANTALDGFVVSVLNSATNELYVDNDANGSIDAGDTIIKLTGVTNLSAADFNF